MPRLQRPPDSDDSTVEAGMRGMAAPDLKMFCARHVQHLGQAGTLPMRERPRRHAQGTGAWPCR